MQHPVDCSVVVGLSLGLLPGQLPTDVVSCADQCLWGGGVPHAVLTGLARDDIRSIDLRCFLQWLHSQVLQRSPTPVKGVVPPGVGVPYNIDDTATGG